MHEARNGQHLLACIAGHGVNFWGAHVKIAAKSF
jgi:hypothetical protein